MSTNPRKFIDKIAILKQKNAEGNAAYDQIMRELSATTKMQAKEKINEISLNSNSINGRIQNISPKLEKETQRYVEIQPTILPFKNYAASTPTSSTFLISMPFNNLNNNANIPNIVETQSYVNLDNFIHYPYELSTSLSENFFNKPPPPSYGQKSLSSEMLPIKPIIESNQSRSHETIYSQNCNSLMFDVNAIYFEQGLNTSRSANDIHMAPEHRNNRSPHFYDKHLKKSQNRRTRPIRDHSKSKRISGEKRNDSPYNSSIFLTPLNGMRRSSSDSAIPSSLQVNSKIFSMMNNKAMYDDNQNYDAPSLPPYPDSTSDTYTSIPTTPIITITDDFDNLIQADSRNLIVPCDLSSPSWDKFLSETEKLGKIDASQSQNQEVKNTTMKFSNSVQSNVIDSVSYSQFNNDLTSLPLIESLSNYDFNQLLRLNEQDTKNVNDLLLGKNCRNFILPSEMTYKGNIANDEYCALDSNIIDSYVTTSPLQINKFSPLNLNKDLKFYENDQKLELHDSNNNYNVTAQCKPEDMANLSYFTYTGAHQNIENQITNNSLTMSNYIYKHSNENTEIPESQDYYSEIFQLHHP